jgi:hypothetical protein
MNLTNQQELFDTINKADNSQLWSTCGVIARSAEKSAKLLAQATHREEQHREEEKKKGLDSQDTANLTDEELRLRVKRHLLVKLSDGSLSGSDIGQLKDIFGLASKTEELTIEVVDYANAIIDCPHCGENVHRTSTIVPG